MQNGYSIVQNDCGALSIGANFTNGMIWNHESIVIKIHVMKKRIRSMYGICVIKAGIVLSIVDDKYSRKIGNILGAFNYANYFEFTESHFVG